VPGATITISIALLLPFLLRPASTAVATTRPSYNSGEGSQASAPPSRSGDELYRWACAACHGVDGTGAPQSLVGFDIPLPDFTDCAFSTVEPDADWLAVVHDGGPARAFDPQMPAFGMALSREQIQAILDRTRGFCTSDEWPRGELNLPRPLVTEKAFPENEAVLTTSVGNESVITELLYEQRFGARNQFEVVVPLALKQGSTGRWERGLGDVAIAFKRALFHSLARGSILSVAGEVVFPTGKETRDLGKGVNVFEPFVAYGQMLDGNAFLQVQAGAELSTDTGRSSHETFWRATIGATFEEARFGRAWSPMVEALAAREVGGNGVEWDVLPQLQVTLSKRQHIMINSGVRIPLTNREERGTQVITYFLWDWFDGGLLDGWR
jgi:hypothetical protein